MIDGGADDRQAQSNVAGLAEAFVLEHGQPLIVIHRQHRVCVGQVFGRKQRIRWQRPQQVNAFGAQLFQDRFDDVPFFGAQMAAFARMGIQTADQNGGARNAEAGPQVAIENADDAAQQRRGDGSSHLRQGQVRGGQRHAQTFGGQHHHCKVHLTFLRQKFGVSGKRDAGVIDHALVHGRCHHRGDIALLAGPHGDPQRVEHIGSVRGVQRAGLHWRAQGHRQHAQCAGRRGSGGKGGVEGQNLQRQAQQGGALHEELRVGDDNPFNAVVRVLRQLDAQVGTNAGGFAGGYGDAFDHGGLATHGGLILT